MTIMREQHEGVLDSYKIDAVDWKTVKCIGLLGIDEIAKLKCHHDYMTFDASHGERSDGEYSAKGVDFVRQRCDGGLSLRSP